MFEVGASHLLSKSASSPNEASGNFSIQLFLPVLKSVSDYFICAMKLTLYRNTTLSNYFVTNVVLRVNEDACCNRNFASEKITGMQSLQSFIITKYETKELNTHGSGDKYIQNSYQKI
jgi:hypothetical protein